MDVNELSSSLEDYLETILLLTREHQVARAKEIGQNLQVNRSSVTLALQTLSKRGLIHYAPYSYVTLTDAGQKIAEDVAQRHAVLQEFMEKVLHVPVAEADRAACGMEHALSGVVLERLAQFMEFVNRCPGGVARWEPAQGFRCERHGRGPSCEKCTQSTRSRASAGVTRRLRHR